MKEFDEPTRKRIWDATTIAPAGYENTLLRKDRYGAWVQYDKYKDDDSEFRWHIDHICPRAILEKKGISEEKINADINLQVMHYRNNESKNDDYPTFHIKVTSRGIFNIEVEEMRTIDLVKQEELKRFYNL